MSAALSHYAEFKIPISNSGVIILLLPDDGPLTAAEWNQFLRTLDAMKPALVVDVAGAS